MEVEDGGCVSWKALAMEEAPRLKAAWLHLCLAPARPSPEMWASSPVGPKRPHGSTDGFSLLPKLQLPMLVFQGGGPWNEAAHFKAGGGGSP